MAKYVLPSTDEESRRLEAQADLYGGTTFLEPVIAEWSPRLDVRVLDVGCGTGHFTRHVSNLLPNAEVVGLDADAARIEFAKEASRRTEGTQPRYVVGSMTELPFDGAAFDLVFTRFVLVHALQPDAAIREMTRVARPGGTVLAHEMVHSGIWFAPRKPAFQRFLDQAVDWLRAQGAEPDQGLYAPGAFRRMGLQAVQADAVAHHALSGTPQFKAYQDNWLATIDSLADSDWLEDGVAPEARAEVEAPTDFLVELTVTTRGLRAPAA